MMGTTGFMFHEKGSFADGISAIGFQDSEVEVYGGVLRQVDTCPMKYLPDLEEAGIRLIGGTAGNTEPNQPKKVAYKKRILFKELL